MKKYQLDEERIFKIAKQIAIALCYLHKKKILHCNLKTQNILVKITFKALGLRRLDNKTMRFRASKIQLLAELR